MPDRETSTAKGGWLTFRLTLMAVILLVLAALSMVAAGPAYRLELLALGDAFSMLRYGAYIAIGAAALGVIALVTAAMRKRLRPGLVSGLVIITAIALVAVPWLQLQRAQQVPPIHDITTDTKEPPAFDALVESREAAPNAVEYPGEEVARQQREAYPEVQPLELDVALSTAREAARAEVQEFGWELAAVTDNSIEATATTPWFGFKDDVVIRLTETREGIRVDMRSASRLGRSDTGTNATRIKAYLRGLEQRLDPTD